MPNKINSSVFDEILGESTNTITDEATKAPESKRPVGRPKNAKSVSRTTFIIEDEQIAKLRAISKTTGFKLKDLMEKVIGDLIERYEAKNGVIDTTILEKKRSIEELL